MGLFSHGKSNNKGFWSTMAVNAFNQGNDQQALQFATLGYEGSVQNIQMAINNRNFKKQQEQMKQQQEELQQKQMRHQPLPNNQQIKIKSKTYKVLDVTLKKQIHRKTVT